MNWGLKQEVILRNLLFLDDNKSSIFILISSFKFLDIDFPTLSIVSFTFLCAPPGNSGTISSMIPNFLQSLDVNFNDSAAIFRLFVSRQSIEAQPAGEITE